MAGTYRYDLTDRQKRIIAQNWGQMSLYQIAEAVGCGRTLVQSTAKKMGLPPLKKSGASTYWTAEDEALLRGLIARGFMPAAIQKTYFPARTYDAVKEKVARIRNGKWVPKNKPETSPPRPEFYQKPMDLKQLEYTIADCPRVTLEHACQWMRQAQRGWIRPADDRQAWREINHERLFGVVPVPPMLPIKRAVHNDNARIVVPDMPEWRVGAR